MLLANEILSGVNKIEGGVGGGLGWLYCAPEVLAELLMKGTMVGEKSGLKEMKSSLT